MHVMIYIVALFTLGKKLFSPLNLSPYWKNTCLPLRMKYTVIKLIFLCSQDL